MINIRKVVISIFFIFFQLCLTQRLVYAIDQKDFKEVNLSQQQLKNITHQIGEYFYTHSLEPFVYAEHVNYAPLGFQELSSENADEQFLYLIGKISEKKEQFDVVFQVFIDKKSKKEHVDFLYFADHAISAQQFVDIYHSALKVAGISSHDVQIYIKNKDYNEKEGGTFDWFFFNNSRVLAHLKIDLKPNGKFSIQYQP
ncbi:MAG: hypothetical protein BGO43_04965 [Gammaproteobacteria bacterium 39-13]|nr:hypothetical protein [Gammaproteobacteria bacterium]OJV96202.1 MAG: hypothetical protein BGO43_04965 [Gammaproteobacteria bacterium 39-13]